MKIYIIGNMGSGKSFLAKKIKLTYLDLDTIFWKGGNFEERDPKVRQSLQQFLDNNNDWVIEGVYTSLAKQIIKESDCLIYLDIPWPECRDNLVSKNVTRLSYAESYYAETRESHGNEIYSRGYHNKIFANFNGNKLKLQNKKEINSLDLSVLIN